MYCIIADLLQVCMVSSQINEHGFVSDCVETAAHGLCELSVKAWEGDTYSEIDTSNKVLINKKATVSFINTTHGGRAMAIGHELFDPAIFYTLLGCIIHALIHTKDFQIPLVTFYCNQIYEDI